MSTFTIFLILILIVAFLLVVVIMVQNPKGGGLSSSFGGGGTQQLGGVQKTTNFLDRSTWTLAIVLIGLILFSNINLMPSRVTTSDILPDVPAAEQPLDLPTDAPAADDATAPEGGE